nr:hypothetical protein [Morganella psychrotolerans]
MQKKSATADFTGIAITKTFNAGANLLTKASAISVRYMGMISGRAKFTTAWLYSVINSKNKEISVAGNINCELKTGNQINPRKNKAIS